MEVPFKPTKTFNFRRGKWFKGTVGSSGLTVYTSKEASRERFETELDLSNTHLVYDEAMRMYREEKAESLKSKQNCLETKDDQLFSQDSSN